jgi:hypothetical protein
MSTRGKAKGRVLSLRKEIALEKARDTEALMELLAVEPASEKLERAERIRKMALTNRYFVHFRKA